MSELMNEIETVLNEHSLMRNRTIFISEGVDSSVAKRVMSQLLRLEAVGPGEPIRIFLNSPGGEVNSGFAIFDVVRFISSPVTMISAGLCASIATVINCAVPKERRVSTPNSKFLIHQPLIGGTIRGQASDLEITANNIIATRERINRLLAEECGQPFERVEKDTTRDYWMTAKESVAYGLVSRVVQNARELG